MSKIFDYLFGKTPDIFDPDGNVVHKFPSEKWQKWKDRFQKNEEYDWHQHRGTHPKIKKPTQ